MSINNFLKYLGIKDMRLIGRRDFAWVSGFPSLGTNTTLVVFNSMEYSIMLNWLAVALGVYPPAVPEFILPIKDC